MSEASIGHNAKQQLLSILERIENLEAQIKELGSDRSDIYSEAKSGGYDIPALKAIVRMRREDADKRAQREAAIDTYKTALGLE